jgi:hypothetical protein
MAEHFPTRLLDRSDELDAAVWGALPDPFVLPVETVRHKASLAAALIAVEQARACRLLLGAGFHTTAIAVNRIQFEALCRSMWLLYAASEAEVAVLVAEPTAANAKKASNVPMAAEMITSLRGKAPHAAHVMLLGYKQAMLKPLHSFLHVGQQPLTRHLAGYPESLLTQILANANGLLLATGAILAILCGSQAAMTRMNGLQREFADCTPLLVAPSQAS